MMNLDLSKYLFKSNVMLEKVNDIYMDDLDDIKTLVSFKKGETLYEEGSIPRAVFRLQKGKVKIEQLNPDGKIRIVYIYTVGEFFGFRPLLSNEVHPVTAIFIEDSEIELYEGKQFIEISKKSPNLSFNLLEILSYEFNVWINLISSLSHKSAKEKIALILLILNEKYSDEHHNSEITMTKADIAKYSETSEETVVRVIRFFESENMLINNSRSIVLKNHKLLSILAEGF